MHIIKFTKAHCSEWGQPGVIICSCLPSRYISFSSCHLAILLGLGRHTWFYNLRNLATVTGSPGTTTTTNMEYQVLFSRLIMKRIEGRIVCVSLAFYS